MYQELIDAEVRGVIGAVPWERNDARTGDHNGSLVRTLTTTAGDLDLGIPKLCSGSFFPSLLECRRKIDQALSAVCQSACHGWGEH